MRVKKIHVVAVCVMLLLPLRLIDEDYFLSNSAMANFAMALCGVVFGVTAIVLSKRKEFVVFKDHLESVAIAFGVILILEVINVLS